MNDEERERRVEKAVSWLAEMSGRYPPLYRSFKEAEAALRELVRKARREGRREKKDKKDESDSGKV